jgi:hypothetical protein
VRLLPLASFGNLWLKNNHRSVLAVLRAAPRVMRGCADFGSTQLL